VRAATLLRLYPRAWRERYGDELLAMTGDGPLSLRKTVDLVAGAVDARVTQGETMPRVLKNLCATGNVQTGLADGVRGAVTIVGVSLLLSGAGILAGRYGWDTVREFVLGISFPASMVAMSHVMYLRRQSAAAKWAITGGTLAILTVITAASIAW
jgi:hypothetical protein